MSKNRLVLSAFDLSQLSKSNMLEICAPAWVAIEKELIEPYSVQAFLTQTGGDVPYRNSVLAFSRESWRWAHQTWHLNNYHTMGSSIWYNKSLKINKKSVMSENWVAGNT